MVGTDLEGCAPSQPCVSSRAINVRFPPCAGETKISSDTMVPTERAPSRRSTRTAGSFAVAFGKLEYLWSNWATTVWEYEKRKI